MLLQAFTSLFTSLRRFSNSFGTLVLLTASLAGMGSSCDPEKKSNRETIMSMYAKYKDLGFSEIEDILPKDAFALQSTGKAVIVDVRSDKEMQVSMVKDAISREELERDLAKYQNTLIIPYCTIGYRSGLYVQDLTKKGLKARNLTGSVLLWAHDGLPFTRAGAPTLDVHVYSEEWNFLPESHHAKWSDE